MSGAMTCRSFRKALEACRDERPSAATEAALRDHRLACSACAALAEDEARLAGALESLRAVQETPPPHFTASVREEVARRQAAEPLGAPAAARSASPFKLALLAPALAAAALVGWAFLGGKTSLPPPRIVATRVGVPPAAAATSGLAGASQPADVEPVADGLSGPLLFSDDAMELRVSPRLVSFAQHAAPGMTSGSDEIPPSQLVPPGPAPTDASPSTAGAPGHGTHDDRRPAPARSSRLIEWRF